MYEIAVTGIDKLEKALAERARALSRANRRIVTKNAALLERAAKANFVGSHRPGAPHVGGRFPNVVTGTLRRSIRHSPPVPLGRTGWSTAVGPTASYGRDVEKGRPGRSRAFPYLFPAARMTTAGMAANAAREWRFL